MTKHRDETEIHNYTVSRNYQKSEGLLDELRSVSTDVVVHQGGGAEKVRSGEAMSEQGGDVGAGGRWGAAGLVMGMQAAVSLRDGRSGAASLLVQDYPDSYPTDPTHILFHRLSSLLLVGSRITSILRSSPLSGVQPSINSIFRCPTQVALRSSASTPTSPTRSSTIAVSLSLSSLATLLQRLCAPANSNLSTSNLQFPEQATERDYQIHIGFSTYRIGSSSINSYDKFSVAILIVLLMFNFKRKVISLDRFCHQHLVKSKRVCVFIMVNDMGVDIPSTLCPLCGDFEENATHLFFECSKIARGWQKFGAWWSVDIPHLKNVQDLFNWSWFTQSHQKDRLKFQAAFSAVLVFIWRYRNGVVFENKKVEVELDFLVEDQPLLLLYTMVMFYASCNVWVKMTQSGYGLMAHRNKIYGGLPLPSDSHGGPCGQQDWTGYPGPVPNPDHTNFYR
ncbi:hypothetical protein LXL04_038738 [Taraxacum kok-saghyz]